MKVSHTAEDDSLTVELNPSVGDRREYRTNDFSIQLDSEGTLVEVVIRNAGRFVARVLQAGVLIDESTTPTSPTNVPTWEEVDSSMITGFKYDPTERVLSVMFTRTGLYHYFNVPTGVVDGLRHATSAGSYMRSVIIDQYDCEKEGW